MDETTGTETETSTEVVDSSGPVEETTEQQPTDEWGESCLGFIAFKTRPC